VRRPAVRDPSEITSEQVTSSAMTAAYSVNPVGLR